jgi:LysM repeat protein
MNAVIQTLNKGKNAYFNLMRTLHRTSNIVHLTFYPPLSIAAFLMVAQLAFAKNQADTIKYLTAKDTVFLSLDDKTGEKIIEHRIQKGQTLYSLARFYGLNEEELFPYNPNLQSNKLPIGQVVRVPIPNGAIKRFKGDNFKMWKYAPIHFVVKKGDNVYKIAKTLFHMPVDSVLKWNNLPNQTIQPGQRLFVGWVSIDGVNDSLRNGRKPSIDIHVLKDDYGKVKKSNQVQESGAAFWQTKGNAKTDLYCLHRTAKVGSVISVTNTMNSKTTYAKVIGRMPANIYGSETIIVVAPSVAKLLGAKDEKFFVKISYSK